MSEMEDEEEVIFESWFYKFQGLDGRSTFRLSSAWKKKYFILVRESTTACLLYYDKKPRALQETPKGRIDLAPEYKVVKRRDVKGKPFVCELTKDDKRYMLATDDEKIFHLFMFFLQSQTKLQDDLEESCFVVRPDNSEDHKKIGARGNMCLLHISKWGILLALQLSKCVLAVWPVKCIKSYESTGMGLFGIETGKKSPTGEGKYSFNARRGQDNVIYDVIDRYIMEAAGLCQMVTARSSNPPENLVESLEAQHGHLQDFTVVFSDPRFTGHLKKISRDIYDFLAEHLGFSTATRLNASNPDLLADSASSTRLASFQRSGSSHSAAAAAPASAPVQILRSDSSRSVPSRRPNIVTPDDARGRHPALDPSRQPDSQYLHMGTSDGTPGSITPDGKYVNLKMSLPPVVGAINDITPYVPPSDGVQQVESTPAAAKAEKAEPPLMKPIKRTLFKKENCNGNSDWPVARLRVKSRSFDNLNEYAKMADDIKHLTYENETFRMSDELLQRASCGSPGLYAYINPSQIENGGIYSYASPNDVATSSDNKRMDFRNRAAVGHYSLEKPHIKAKPKQLKGVDLRTLYSRPVSRTLRRSMSNPNLTESMLAKQMRPPYFHMASTPVSNVPAQDVATTGRRKNSKPTFNFSFFSKSPATAASPSKTDRESPPRGSRTSSELSFSSSTTSGSAMNRGSAPKTPVTPHDIRFTQRSKSYKKQTSTGSAEIASQPATEPEVVMRRQDSENGSLIGRRLPSLPPEAQNQHKPQMEIYMESLC